MKPSTIRRSLSMLLPALVAGSIATADVKLPAVLDSHMVVQRDQPVRIWGWADADEQVTVTLGNQTKTTNANGAGQWLVVMDPQVADGTPRQIKVVGKQNEILLDDVLVGEVWIGSGQSNMEWPLSNTIGASAAIADADLPGLRLFHVPKLQTKTPSDDVNAVWKVCNSESVPAFSAVLFHFGRQLHAELNLPIGLINSSWGGSPIEPWTIKGENSGGMYNGMIAPLTNVAVRGAIWYQGETNVLQKNGMAYFEKKKDLIAGWREAFQNDKLAFYFVQIAPWSGRYEPGQLPALWEAQAASLTIPHTGMVVTTDLVDDIADIHPRNKTDVGHRLSLWALKKSYGRDNLVCSGPLYVASEVNGSRIRLTFAHTGEGLKTNDGKAPTEFQIADATGSFVPAVAEIEGHTVVVHSDSVASPTQVQFGWHKVAQPNLINSAGLPASPFQTHQWQGGTGIE